MKKFATVILTALCATAIVSAQPTTAAPIDAQQTAPAQAAAPIDAQPAADAQTNDAMPIDEQPVPAPKKGNIGIGAKASFIFGNFWGFKDLSDGLDEPSGFGGDFGATLRFDIIDGLKCPRCGALLETQSCFNKYDDDWECTECGAHLHHSYSDDEYEEIEEPKYRCPECGASLDSQCGFSEYDDDWECTECGARLHRDYSFEEYSIVEDDEDDTDADEEADDEDYESDDSSYSYSSGSSNWQSSSKNTYRSYQAPPKASTTYSTPKTKKKSGRLLIIILLLLLLGAVGYMGREYIPKIKEAESHPGEIKLSYSASYYKDENYYSALIKLLKQGLSDIRLTPLNDLEGGLFSGDGKKDGKVETIEINGISDFQADSWVSENSVVSISYHSFQKAEKAGYETSKNNHLIISGMDIELPSYFIEDAQDATNAAYHVKGDDETCFTILYDDNEEWTGLSEYETHFVLEQRSSSFSGMPGKEILALGKKNDKVNLIHTTTLATSSDPDYLHIIMTSPDNSKIDYDSDYKAVVSGIYIPKDFKGLQGTEHQRCYCCLGGKRLSECQS